MTRTKWDSYSQEEPRRGSQSPSVRICPNYHESDGEDAVTLLSAAGLECDPWQEDMLCDWMARDGDRWAFQSCGLAVPRQNGKTLTIDGRSSSGTVMYSEWVIYTAHLQKTATETFLEIRGLFETPALEKYVKEIRSAIGREQIILKNGGRIIFVARTRNGGRGLHGDCLIFDEAQELTVEQQASFLPALAASKNPQVIYAGTPPDPNCTGTVFRDLRGKARAGKTKNTVWSEFSVDSLENVGDKEKWYATNPALGIRILESTVASEYEQMPTDTFARERLGWWAEDHRQEIDYAIDSKAWEQCQSDEQKPEGKTAYGVKFSPDGREVVLAGAVLSDGKARISMIKRESTSRGIRWLSDWLNERYTKASCVVIDGRNGTDLLIDRISETWKMKGSILRPKTADIIASASLVVDAVNENSLTWYRLQEDLDDSARTSVKRPINGGWGFGGENSLPIEACSLALWGVKTSKRDPNKKMRIG